MSGTVSKQVATRESYATEVVSSAALHGGEVVEPVEELLFPDGVPSRVTVKRLIDAFGAALERSTIEMREADLELSREAADADLGRSDRDAMVSVVRETIVDYRDVVNGSYGSKAVIACGLIGETPRSGEELCNHAENVVRNLKRSPFDGHSPKPGRPVLDARAMAAALGDSVESLRKMLGAVTREEREYQLALERRDAAVDRWMVVYRGTAEALSACFLLGGRPELADRVRPTIRRAIGQPDGTVVTDGAVSTSSTGESVEGSTVEEWEGPTE